MNIKSLICLVLSVILVVLLTACSSPEKEETSKYALLNSEEETVMGPYEPYLRCVVNISMENLKMDLFEKEFAFQANVISKDNGVDLPKTQSSFADQKEAGNLFPAIPTVLELQFLDSIPKSVTWYGIYVKDGSIAYPSLSIPMPINYVDGKAILPIGPNLAIPLDSDLTLKKYYRVIRIVCEYDNQQVEYNIFFDCVNAEGCLPQTIAT